AKVEDPYIAIGITEIHGQARVVGRKPRPVIIAAPDRTEVLALPIVPAQFPLHRMSTRLIYQNAILRGAEDRSPGAGVLGDILRDSSRISGELQFVSIERLRHQRSAMEIEQIPGGVFRLCKGVHERSIQLAIE